MQALKAAQELVQSTKQAVEEQTDNFAESEVKFLQRVEESEKLSAALERRQERVRAALHRKERALVDGIGGFEPIEGVETECYLSESEIECNQRNLQELKKKESFLLAEGSRLEQRAMRLQSRADKLKARAEFIDQL
jgi:phage shock protein A